MERRLFQLLCLVGTFLGWFVVIPMNIAQNLPWTLNAVVGGFGLVSLAFYLASLRGRHHLKTFTVLVMVMLNLCWFNNAGSHGSIAMFFFAGVMVISIFFRGATRGLLLAVFMVNVVVLLTLDYLHPEWSIPFNSARDRYWDLVTGFLASSAACLLMLWVVVASHDAERKRLTDLNQELQRNLDEIQTLQGMLPICSWCKKVRDDEGLWTQVEHYLAEKTDLSFTHGMCPECAREQFPKATREGLEAPSGPQPSLRSPDSP